MAKIIDQDRSVIPACDVPTLEKLKELVEQTHDIAGIGAYKVGFELAIPFGLKVVVETIREFTDKPIIYDHQKAGTDIPDMGKNFALACRKVGLDAVILFPQAGPVTEKAWILACKEAGLAVIVGGEMTHPGYLEDDDGFIKGDSPGRMYELAIELGVEDFVVPGNKPEKILEYRKLFEAKGVNATLYSPGLVAQGGKITDSGKAAGQRWHAIVGRAIYLAKDIRGAAVEASRNLW